MNVAVVGGGVMGASIAFHLASRGLDVTLYERNTICSGPTRHSTAIIRMHYSQALLVQMAVHGLRVYRAFSEIVGASAGFTRTGMLFGVAERERAMLEANVQLGQAEGVETHIVDVDDVDPRIDSDGMVFCFEPEAGYCDPYAVTHGFVAAATRAGATVRERAAVEDVDTLGADAVVVAAGPWTRPLLTPLGYDLPLSAAPAEVGRYRLPADCDAPPVVADFSEAQFYFRPAEPGIVEVGSLAPEHPETPVDPDRPIEGARLETLRAYEAALARRLRGSAGGHWRGAWTGIYDVTPDWEPVIGRVPGRDDVFVAAGFSGHGFKLAPAVGAAISELVCDGESRSFDLSLLAPERFARGELVGARYGYSVLG